ncbi:MAG TPA: hypothetical protein PKH02_00570 [Bacteroidales bacterium]|nr:hypothetical protein [Bacteroidales bacterium]HPT11044.1 hypothetical protein [Bacteroidales bacterium]
MVRKLLFVFIGLLIIVSCKSKGEGEGEANNNIVITSEVITPSYLGNGVQWGGYDNLMQWTGSATLSETDWNKLFQRVRFMRPPVVRIMTADGWNYLINGIYDPAKSNDILIKILDFCEEEGITVIFGEWGHKGGSSVDESWLEKSASFLEWLLKTKNYTCIKYYNMVNEPNGSWSSTKGNYDLWVSIIEKFNSKLIEKGIDTKISITGPDIAIWNTGSTFWISDTHYDLGAKIGAYDIHTYPTETSVRDGSYFEMIKAYKEEVPESSAMIMSEFGFKYSASSELGIENEERKNNDPYASDDSNMMIYDAFYGIDVADAIMQIMLAGYSGSIMWDLDDAMYNIDGGSSTLLKRWGFWNILGSEKFGDSSDENIRPWFYTVSLMSRYFPAGTRIFGITLPDKKGLRAIAGEKNGKYTIAIVNSNYVDYSISLSMENGINMTSVNLYKYISGDGSSFTGNKDNNGFASPYETGSGLDFTGEKKINLDIKARSFTLFTNME